MILYTVFSNKILPGIASNIHDRKQSIENDLEMAEKLTKDAENFKSAFEEELAQAKSNAAQMIADLDADMREEHEKKQAAFLKQSEEKINEAKKNIEKASVKSMKDIEAHIEETSLLAAKAIAGIDTDGKVVKAALKAINSNIKVEAA